MSKMNQPFMLLIAVFVICCYPLALSANTATKQDTPEKVRKVAARVNGQPIYEDALTPYIDKELRKFKKFGPKRDTTDLEERLKRKALDRVISQELLDQASRKLEIRDIDKKVQEKIEGMKEKYKDEEHFKSMMKEKNLTEEGIRKNLRERIYLEEYLIKQGILNPEIPEEEIKEYYEKHQKNFKRDEYVEASHILIKTDQEAPPEEKEKAREKAEKIRKDILDGKDFAEMAIEHSEDGAAPGGGNLGNIRRGYMPHEFEKAAYSMDKGEISEIVQTRHGYHIIKVTERKPGGIAPYEDVKDFIRKYLQEGKYKEKLSAHVKELKEKAKIEILLDKS